MRYVLQKHQDAAGKVLQSHSNVARWDLEALLSQLSSFELAVASRIALRSLFFLPEFTRKCSSLPDSRFGIVTERKCAGRQCPLTDVDDGVIVEIVSLGSTAAADVDKPENLV